MYFLGIIINQLTYWAVRMDRYEAVLNFSPGRARSWELKLGKLWTTKGILFPSEFWDLGMDDLQIVIVMVRFLKKLCKRDNTPGECCYLSLYTEYGHQIGLQAYGIEMENELLRRTFGVVTNWRRQSTIGKRLPRKDEKLPNYLWYVYHIANDPTSKSTPN